MSDEQSDRKQFGALAKRESPFDEKLTTAITTAFGITKEQANVAMQTLLKPKDRNLPNLAIALSYCKQLGVNPLSVGGGLWFADMGRGLVCLVHYGAMKGVCEETGKLWSCKSVAVYEGEEFKFDPFLGTFDYTPDYTKRKGKPIGAVSVVVRAENEEQAEEPRNKYVVFAPFMTYCKSGKEDSAWQSSPEIMIEKAAMRRALKDAFAAKLYGVYTPEEMSDVIDVTPVDEPKTKGRSDKPDYLEETKEPEVYELVINKGMVAIASELFAHEALKEYEGQTIYVKNNAGIWYATIPNDGEVPLKQYKKRGRPKKKQEPIIETVKRQSKPEGQSQPAPMDTQKNEPDTTQTTEPLDAEKDQDDDNQQPGFTEAEKRQIQEKERKTLGDLFGGKGK